MSRKSKNPQVIVDGMVFTKQEKRGYYLSARAIGDKRVELHRYIWSKHNGPIHEGYQVHHKDHNQDNNLVENLELLPLSKHMAYHSNKYIKEHFKEKRETFLKATQEAAKEWHKSEEGREWHSEHGKKIWEERKKNEAPSIIKCIVCGSEKETYYPERTFLCSKKCKAKKRRDDKVDDVKRNCVICGKEFSTNKNGDVITCSRKCGGLLNAQNRKAKISKGDIN